MNNLPYALFDKFFKELLDTIRSIPIGTEIELMDHQKFALAILAGVPIEKTEYKDGRMHLTTVPCAVVWNGSQWEVKYRKEPQA